MSKQKVFSSLYMILGIAAFSGSIIHLLCRINTIGFDFGYELSMIYGSASFFVICLYEVLKSKSAKMMLIKISWKILLFSWILIVVIFRGIFDQWFYVFIPFFTSLCVAILPKIRAKLPFQWW